MSAFKNWRQCFLLAGHLRCDTYVSLSIFRLRSFDGQRLLLSRNHTVPQRVRAIVLSRIIVDLDVPLRAHQTGYGHQSSAGDACLLVACLTGAINTRPNYLSLMRSLSFEIYKRPDQTRRPR